MVEDSTKGKHYRTRSDSLFPTLLLLRDTQRGRDVISKESESGTGTLRRFGATQHLFHSVFKVKRSVHASGTLSIPQAEW